VNFLNGTGFDAIVVSAPAPWWERLLEADNAVTTAVQGLELGAVHRWEQLRLYDLRIAFRKIA